MKPSKKFKIDEIINSLLDSDDNYDSDEDSFDDKTLQNRKQKTPLKSIQNQINIKIQTPIKLKSVILEEKNDDEPMESDEDDDDVPLAVLAAKKNPNQNIESPESDDDDDDIPLSKFIKSQNPNTTKLKSQLTNLDLKYKPIRHKFLDNSCLFFVGIYDASIESDYTELNLNKDNLNDLSYVDDSDYEEDSTVPSSPILIHQSNFVLNLKNSKRKF
ncbi:unnamed protein product [Brachionus calyciflorus]|uniref:Uncharacterized protein n=1 Tax=Brachionus calyciflorus TaxID=104777 RepID=A0A813RUG7_9BILA|nr:unnamed protein product [Brachionus calyciflorus]